VTGKSTAGSATRGWAWRIALEQPSNKSSESAKLGLEKAR
jgi:hypothetical protein